MHLDSYITGRLNQHKIGHVLDEAKHSLCNVSNCSLPLGKLTKLFVTTALPVVSAEMLADTGHVLRVSENTKFDAYEHKLLLSALADYASGLKSGGSAMDTQGHSPLPSAILLCICASLWVSGLL